MDHLLGSLISNKILKFQNIHLVENNVVKKKLQGPNDTTLFFWETCKPALIVTHHYQTVFEINMLAVLLFGYLCHDIERAAGEKKFDSKTSTFFAVRHLIHIMFFWSGKPGLLNDSYLQILDIGCKFSEIS